MTSKKKIPEGTPLPVRLSSAERILIREHTFYDPQFCSDVGDDAGLITLNMDLDTIEEFQGYVAAEANHTEDRKLEQSPPAMRSRRGPCYLYGRGLTTSISPATFARRYTGQI